MVKRDNMPTVQAVESYLAGVQEIGFEVFFSTAFLGLRWQGTAQHVQSVALACVQAQRDCRAGVSFFPRLPDLLGVAPWGQCVEFA